MLFEGDPVGKPMHRVSANGGCAVVEAHPRWRRFRRAADSVEGGRDRVEELGARPSRCSSYQRAALRSSARASGCSSTRTPFVEFLQDLGSCCVPIGRLDASVRDRARPALQLDGPRGRDLIVRLFQARE
jgi:hypothetical protein